MAVSALTAMACLFPNPLFWAGATTCSASLSVLHRCKQGHIDFFICCTDPKDRCYNYSPSSHRCWIAHVIDRKKCLASPLCLVGPVLLRYVSWGVGTDEEASSYLGPSWLLSLAFRDLLKGNHDPNQDDRTCARITIPVR